MDRVQFETYRQRLQALPTGGITYKTIRGHRYAYYQWMENGKQRARRVKDEELESLTAQLKERKEILELLKQERGAGGAFEVRETPSRYGRPVAEPSYLNTVLTGTALRQVAWSARNLKKRECFTRLKDFVFGDSTDRVFVLYGLRRTGKTTLIRQVLLEMDDDMFSRAALVQVTPRTTLQSINLDMRRIWQAGFHYVFLDEVTLMEDFIDCASIFSDVFAAMGMKIVLSGTDSLSFAFSEDESLYDRCVMEHTTFIPYREFSEVLGIHGIDEYISYGGTMSLGGTHYNPEGLPFYTAQSADEYVDSAIAKNIQHSLKNYQGGRFFQSLQELYEKNELTGAVNRVVEDMNHQFTLDVLTREFKSNDLSISAKNLLKDREKPSDVLYRIDGPQVTDRLKSMLEVRNKEEQQVKLTEVHVAEIKEYLHLLDLIEYTKTVDILNPGEPVQNTVISQPGLRYAQAKALIEALIQDRMFSALSLTERRAVTERILSEVKGRMLEEIVLLETQMALPKQKVFKLRFAVGEFDMVIFDPEQGECRVFEIKHSDKQVPEQTKHLLDKEKAMLAEHRFGPIRGRFVLYLGPTADAKRGIRYVNVEEFLLDIRGVSGTT